MTSDYDQILSENLHKYGHEWEQYDFLQDLHPDQTHFVFELLQNAEDAEAHKVCFGLFSDRLELRHDGRLFDEADVRGVCAIGKGTKVGDLTKIGKFGIGFKSVYAYTSTPEIHCGDEHFRIEHYVRPYATTELDPGRGWTTLFVFPFDAPGADAKRAWKEIVGRLRNLSARTLLFLRNIEEVEYEAANACKGVYICQQNPMGGGRQVTVVAQNDGKEEEETWLVFDKLVPNEITEDEIRVEIGFQLQTDEKTDRQKVVREVATRLVVFFPTERETKLGFLIQGPYQTTPGRESVRENNDWNKLLIDQTSILVADSLRDLKGMGLLSVGALEALPIREEDFPSGGMFRPIWDKVKHVLQENPLLPTDQGGFVSGKRAKLGRTADLRKLLPKKRLQELYHTNAELDWLSGDITQDRTPDLRTYILSHLDIEEVTPEDFARRIDEDFLTKQTIEWMIDFYHFLSVQEALWRAPRWSWDTPGPMRSKAFVRAKDGTHFVPFGSDGQPNIYLPVSGQSEQVEVDPKIVADEGALDFLKKLGLREVGEREAIQSILKSHYLPGADNPTHSAHLEHMKMFVAWVKKTDEKALFEDCYLFFDSQGESMYPPEDCYLDSPIKYTGLSCLFDHMEGDDNEPERVPLWPKYASLDGFVAFAAALGVMDELPITPRSITEHPESDKLRTDWYKYNVRETSTAIREDYWIADLDIYLERQSRSIGKLIWDTLRKADSSVLKARYRPNQQYDIREAASSLVHALRKHPWIPTKSGTFLAPSDCTRDGLPDEFVYDNSTGWLTAIQFGQDKEKLATEQMVKEAYARALGIKDMRFVQIASDLESDPDLLALFESAKAKRLKASFPNKESGNAEARAENILARLKEAPPKTYEQQLVSVRTSRPSIDPSTWLRELYTNDDGQMVCQICQLEMPFKKRDGEHYFEAVEAVNSANVELEQLFLALCPVCAAKYQEFIKRDQASMTVVEVRIKETDQPAITLELCGQECTLRFVEKHFKDLRAVLKSS